MSAQLGFSFRWVFQMPDQGVTFDSFGRPHSGIFVFNSGTEVARGVRFRGCCTATPTESTQLLSVMPWSVPKDAHPAMPPLWYQFEGPEMVGARPLYAFGEVRCANAEVERFAVVWAGGAWQTIEWNAP